MTSLPFELAAFASLLDAQPASARDAFNYCLALLMVEAGKARLVETVPGENGAVCVFESSAGEQFSLPKPAMTDKMEAGVKEMLREILDEEGWL